MYRYLGFLTALHSTAPLQELPQWILAAGTSAVPGLFLALLPPPSPTARDATIPCAAVAASVLPESPGRSRPWFSSKLHLETIPPFLTSYAIPYTSALQQLRPSPSRLRTREKSRKPNKN